MNQELVTKKLKVVVPSLFLESMALINIELDESMLDKDYPGTNADAVKEALQIAIGNWVLETDDGKGFYAKKGGQICIDDTIEAFAIPSFGEYLEAIGICSMSIEVLTSDTGSYWYFEDPLVDDDQLEFLATLSFDDEVDLVAVDEDTP